MNRKIFQNLTYRINDINISESNKEIITKIKTNFKQSYGIKKMTQDK